MITEGFMSSGEVSIWVLLFCYCTLRFSDMCICFTAAGYDVYLVGGCVRDLIMKKIPKDFDIITTADLRQVITHINEHAIVMQ